MPFLTNISRLLLGVLLSLCILFLTAACKDDPSTLEKIKQTGTITMITQNNAHTYYLYRDSKAGFEYELAREFAEFLGVDLHVVTPGWSEMIDYLNNGKGDFIAAGLTITDTRKELVDFSQGYMRVQQHIIQHQQSTDLKTVEDLHGLTMHIRKGTSYEERLLQLIDQGIDLELVFHEDIPTEELIDMVSHKKIALTVADSNIAKLNRRFYPEIKITLPIAEEQSLGWAVRKKDDTLLKKINEFFDYAYKNGMYDNIYNEYYSNVHIFDYVDLIKFHQRISTRLPLYRSIIREEADKYGFDWRMIAAIIYQESHFDPQATSYTGVRGLMQVTRVTAREMGISNRLDPEQSIYAGVKYLAKMRERFEEIPPGRNRLFFALASYNIGYGHVRDAQKLAEEQGLNPNDWESVKETLPLLRNPTYYKKTKYGYARGTEPVRYIERILTYYDILRQKGSQ